MVTSIVSNRNPSDRNADATVHIAQLDEKVSDAILWELMVQAAPVRHVYIPRNRITGAHFGYGFCEFHTPLDAHYAMKILNLVHLYSKPIRISQSTVDRHSQDVGANIFIGNLVDEVDERLLYDSFSAFGPIIDAPYIIRDANTKTSKRFGFVKYTAFEHADSAIAAMNGQYVCNSPIVVQYSFKNGADNAERHGSQAERILAQKGAELRRGPNFDAILRPHTVFADRPRRAHPPPTHVNTASYSHHYAQYQQQQPYVQQSYQYAPYAAHPSSASQPPWAQPHRFNSSTAYHPQSHHEQGPTPVPDETAPPAPH